jgi:hypothetical protein
MVDGCSKVGRRRILVGSVSSAVPLNPGTIPSLTFLEQRMLWLGKFGEQFLEVEEEGVEGPKSHFHCLS